MKMSVFTRQSWIATFLLLFTFFAVSSNFGQITDRLAVSEKTFLSILVIAISIFMLSRSLAYETVAVNSALFWVFNYLFFGLVPFSFSIDPMPYYLGTLSSEKSIQTSYIIIFISSFLVAVTELTSKLHKEKRVSKDNEIRSIDSNRLIKNLKVLTLLYLAFLIPALNYLGWDTYLFRAGWYSDYIIGQSRSLYAMTTTILIVVPIVVTLFLIVLRVEKNVKVSIFWITAYGIWLLILANPSAQSRQQTLFILAPFILIFSKKWKNLVRYSLLLIPVIIIFFANLFSRYTGEFLFGATINVLSRSGDLDAFFQLSNGVELVEMGKFPILRQILGTLFFFLPRNIWESKPLDTGVQIADLFGLKFQNLSAPWPVEAFVNARWLGLIVVSIVIGRFLARSRLNLSIKPHSRVLAGIISGSIFILLRGSLLQATGRIVFSIFLVYVLLLYSREPKGNLQVGKNSV
jgi:hypothetical protein